MNTNEENLVKHFLELANLDEIKELDFEKRENILEFIIDFAESNLDRKQECKDLYNSYYEVDNYDFYEGAIRAKRLTSKYLK